MDAAESFVLLMKARQRKRPTPDLYSSAFEALVGSDYLAAYLTTYVFSCIRATSSEATHADLHEIFSWSLSSFCHNPGTKLRVFGYTFIPE
jgi:hypothetical protein